MEDLVSNLDAQKTFHSDSLLTSEADRTSPLNKSYVQYSSIRKHFWGFFFLTHETIRKDFFFLSSGSFSYLICQ